MAEYVIMADSTCDLEIADAKAMGVEIIPLNLSIGKAEYKAYEGKMDRKSFFNGLREGKTAFTSSPNIQTFMDKMSEVLKTGKDIVYIGLASALSSTYQNACLAADALKKHYPDNKIICIDSKGASLGEGLLITLAAKAKEAGKSIADLCDYIEETVPRVCHWFTVEDLRYLKRGGRFSTTMTSSGSALHFYPVLTVDNEGKLEGSEKVRGRKAAIKALVAKVTKFAADIKDQTVFICHGDCDDDAKELSTMISEKLSPKEIKITCCGPIIGAHAGPGVLSVIFLGERS